MNTSSARLGVAAAALVAGHEIGDFWLQTSAQARDKGDRSSAGRRACARHVASYTAGCAAALAVTARVTGTRLPAGRTAAALALTAGTHYWIDRRFTLEGLARRLEASTGKHTFYRLGAPRAVEVITHGFPADAGPEAGHVGVWGEDGELTSHDNPTLGTGAFALDQSLHKAVAFCAALIIAGGRSR